jgi:hypothetical protein
MKKNNSAAALIKATDQMRPIPKLRRVKKMKDPNRSPSD